MNEQFIPYEQAIALKELGFDEKCFGYYKSFYPFRFSLMSDWKAGISTIKNSEKVKHEDHQGPTAPLWQQAFDWFREKYNLNISIRRVVGNRGTPNESVSWTITHSPWETLVTYKDAQLASLQKLIETIKNETNTN